ncbi:MAG: hypothetical protein LBQ54_16575 [Planctomycetaceae bacterium]|jgi:hypothetical protein|nr:hypothetical protein [Planctomycetaceae bacterium]
MTSNRKNRKSRQDRSSLPATEPPPDDIRRRMSRIPVFAAVFGLLIYGAVFLTGRFEPMESTLQEPFRRGEFPVFYLLHWDLLRDFWFGETNTWQWGAFLSLLLKAALFLLAVFFWGSFFLRILRLSGILTRCERLVFSIALGLNLSSTLILAVGLTFLRLPGVFRLFLSAGTLLFLLGRRRCPPPAVPEPGGPTSASDYRFLLLAVPSLAALFLGSVLPPIEYDAVSYHLPGAKEFFANGVRFMPHNVYTNMPFGAEMYYVWGMNLTGDWYTGALVGKLLIGFTVFLTALGLFAMGRRFCGTFAGIVMFLLYLSIPWVHWTATAGLIDAVVAMYLLFAVFGLWLIHRVPLTPPQQTGLILLTGSMAGAAASCKYTSLLFVVIPLGLMLIPSAAKEGEASLGKRLALYSAGVLFACGLWYLKNFWFTGNPVYPLLYSVFGDSTGTWNAAKNLRWTHAHHAHDFSPNAFVAGIATFLMTSPWLAPAVIPLAVIAVFSRKQERLTRMMLIYLVFFWAAWWLFTHRLDRFFLPVFPILTLLAGLGAALKNERFWKRGMIAVLLFNTGYTLFPETVPAPGKYARFGLGVEAARHDPLRVSPQTSYFNEHPPKGKLLLLGEAAVFDFDVPIFYNTCFDDTIFDEIAAQKSPEAIRQAFHDRNITDILVDWGELKRFRSPGNYGYTSERVTPEQFRRLVQDHVLVPVAELSDDSRTVYRVTP